VNRLIPAPTKEVIFLPDWSRGNPYQNLLAKALEKNGVSITFNDFPIGAFPLNQVVNTNPNCAVLHLHWVNSLVDPIVWCRNPIKRKVKMLLLALDIFVVRLRGKRVIWTIHNLVSHESNNPEWEIKARRVIARTCSHALLHSHSALKLVEKRYRVDLSDKVSIAVHGNYDGCYPSVEGMELKLRERFEIDQDAIVILFFGAIRAYKGVERLIDAFHVVKDRNLRLLIAGSTADDSFAQNILKASKDDSRIIPAIGFVPENEVTALFSISDVVALPFEQTLTSGSATLACTMGKALLVPENAKVFDFVNNHNALFFDSNTQLTAALRKLDKIDLAKRGLHAREAVKGFVWEQEAAKIAATYGK